MNIYILFSPKNLENNINLSKYPIFSKVFNLYFVPMLLIFTVELGKSLAIVIEIAESIQDWKK